jgi:hypothetical protein
VSEDDPELRAACRSADKFLAELEHRESEKRREHKLAAEIARERRLRKAQQQTVAATSATTAAWQALIEERIAAGIAAGLARERAEAAGVVAESREVAAELRDAKRESAAFRDRVATLEKQVVALEARVEKPAPMPQIRLWGPGTVIHAGEIVAHDGCPGRRNETWRRRPRPGPIGRVSQWQERRASQGGHFGCAAHTIPRRPIGSWTLLCRTAARSYASAMGLSNAPGPIFRSSP